MTFNPQNVRKRYELVDQSTVMDVNISLVNKPNEGMKLFLKTSFSIL